MLGSYCNLDYIEKLEAERSDYKRQYYTTNRFCFKLKLLEIEDYMNRYKRYGIKE